MIKAIAIIFAVVACAAAKPGFVAPLTYTSPLVAPGVVTATSSQFVARNHNGIAALLVAAPFVASAPLAYTSPLVAPVAKYVAHHTPLAYTAPVAAYSSPVVAPVSYSSPLTYAAPLATSYANAFQYNAPATKLIASAPVLF